MIAQVITVLIEICFKERRFFNIGKIGKNVMVEIKKRANMAVVGFIYCPIIFALVQEIPQLTMAMISKTISRFFLLFSDLFNKQIKL